MYKPLFLQRTTSSSSNSRPFRATALWMDVPEDFFASLHSLYIIYFLLPVQMHPKIQSSSYGVCWVEGSSCRGWPFLLQVLFCAEKNNNDFLSNNFFSNTMMTNLKISLHKVITISVYFARISEFFVYKKIKSRAKCMPNNNTSGSENT